MDKTLDMVNRLMVEVFNDIVKYEHEALKRSGFTDISVTEAHTVDAIGMYVPKSMSDVAKKLEITVGTLTVAVNNLVKKGYVERTRSDTDRRVVMVSLTKKGRLLYRTHQKFHTDMVKSAIVGLSEYEAKVFGDVLSNINAFFVEKSKIVKQGDTYV